MPQPEYNARLFFFICLIFWFTFNPDNGTGSIAGPSIVKSRLARHRAAHGVLNSTAWGDFNPGSLQDDPSTNLTGYLNLTGFRKEDNFLWDDLDRFKSRCDEWNRHAVGNAETPRPVWQNATGVVQGPWAKLNTSELRYPSSYNLSDITPGVAWLNGLSQWDRNITGESGKMMVRVEDDGGRNAELEQLSQDSPALAAFRAREVAASLNLEDTAGSGSQFEMRLHGVHWPTQGAILLTTTSAKYEGIFGLPHLTSRPEYFQTSQLLLNGTLDEILKKKEVYSYMDQVDPWSATMNAPTDAYYPSPHCEYLVYLQVHAPSYDALKLQPTLPESESIAQAIQDIESELRFPQGVPHRGTPNLQMSAVVYSPDCALFLESKGPPSYTAVEGEHLMGMKQETFLYSVTTWILAFGLVIFGQVQLLKIQMREASTPSTLGRISFYTASLMLLADGIVFAGASAWALSASTTLLPSLFLTCASFLSMTIGVFFLAEIFKVQEPEWRRQERERERERERTRERQRQDAIAARQANPPAPASSDQNDATPGNPGETRQTPADAPIIIPSDQDIDVEILEADTHGNPNATGTLPAPATAANPTPNAQNQGLNLGSVFGRLIMLGVCILFTSLAALEAAPGVQSVFYNLIGFFYLSLWVPQIYRNVYRNCRQALLWQFVFGQSILRLLPIAYFYLWEGNFAFVEPDGYAFTVLAGWVWIQLCVLVAQSVLGPRILVPKGWMPEAWEYHPILREDNIEAGGLPIGLVSETPGSPTLERVKTGEEGKEKKTNTHVIDCAICREVLEVPVLKAGNDDPTAGGVAGVFARRLYMVTPCRHIFHSACLEGWMRFRLQCPICREELPPL